MIPDQNILTALTIEFKGIAEKAVVSLTPTAIALLFSLMAIAYLVYFLILLMMEDYRSPDALAYVKLSIKELFKYGGFAFMVFSYQMIMNALVASFFKIGGVVGGGGITEKVFSSPSLISKVGLDLMLPIWENYVTSNIGKIAADVFIFIAGVATGGATSFIVKGLQYTLGAIKPNSLIIMCFMVLITFIVIGCFFVMAANIFVIQIEFAIVAAVSLILIPFGVWNKTEFIWHDAKKNIISMGIKYMVLTTILSISIGLMKSVQMPTSPSYQQICMFLVMVVALTAMNLFLPAKIAADIKG